MRHFRRAVIGVALLTIGLCTQARAQQVLEQVPSDAVGVFEVKDLQGVSAKIAKLAKTLGIDQFQPQWADPLGSVQDQMGVTKGLNKSGDMAIAFFNPKGNGGLEGPAGGDQVPPLVVLLPTDDYKAFLGNFQDVKDAGNGMSEVTVPKNGEKLFIKERGKYAEAAMNKDLLGRPAGMKIQGPAAQEAKTKDAILYFDMKALRPHLQQGYKQVVEGIQKQLKENNQIGAQIPPAMIALLDKGISQFINDSKSVALAFNLNDAGLGTSFVSDFEPQSYCGKLVSDAKNTDQPMFAGLPKRTYLMYFGAMVTPQVVDQIFKDVADTIKQNPGKGNPDALNKYLDDSHRALTATRSMAGGMVAPEAGESFIQIVSILKGQAQQIFDGTKSAMANAGAVSALSGDQKVKTTVTMGTPTTIDGVNLQPYTMTFDFDPNDPMAAQQKQIMSMLYGRNGLVGDLGVVNDETVLNIEGGSQKLLTDSIAAAKEGSNNIDNAAELKDVKAQLPRERSAEFYLALDNVASTVVKIAKQQGMAVQFRLPPNLPPIGVTVGTDGTAARVDAFIPTKLVESMTSAVMQTIMQMNGGGGNGGV